MRVKIMESIVVPLERITRFIGRLFAWLMLPLVLALCYEVFARYLFNSPTIWSYEVGYMLMAAIFLLGAAYTLVEGRHIRIDFLYIRLSPKKRAIIDLAGFLILFLPAMSVISYFAVAKAIEAVMVWEVSDISPWRPAMWPFRTSMAIGFVLLTIQGFCEVMKNIARIRSSPQKGSK
jgi:TRAP-type mannitol/chloroaromatic compound transport system permease small subunit